MKTTLEKWDNLIETLGWGDIAPKAENKLRLFLTEAIKQARAEERKKALEKIKKTKADYHPDFNDLQENYADGYNSAVEDILEKLKSTL